jgi:hypothetical protein
MPNGVENKGSRDILQAVREDSRRKLMSRVSRVLRKLSLVTTTVGLLDFLLFLAGVFYFGGDAWNGKAEAGRYFLWGYHNGTKGYIEVSQAVFDYSKWHVYSVVVIWTLMLLVGFASSRIGRSED